MLGFISIAFRYTFILKLSYLYMNQENKDN